MTEQDIRELLEDLGSKVSLIAEENRVCKNRDDAGQQLINLLDEYIAEDDWVKIYKATNNPFINRPIGFVNMYPLSDNELKE